MDNCPSYCIQMHISECNAPIEIIKLILDTYPDAIMAQDDNGNVPLNYIMQHQFFQTQRMVRDTNDKKLDHYKMKYVLQVIEELLNVGPSSVLIENQNGKNFFEMFVEIFYPPTRVLMDSTDVSIIDYPERLLNHVLKVEEGTLYTVSFVYDTIIILLKAAFGCNCNDTSTEKDSKLQQIFLPLHASICNKRCPYVFSELITRIDPSQALLLNSDCNLLLYFSAKICYSSLTMDYGFDDDLEFEYKRVLLWERFSNPLLCDDEREQMQVLFLILRENPLLLHVNKTD